MQEIKRTRFTLDEIRELLGRNADERLITALLRKQAHKVIEVTPEEITRALSFLDGTGKEDRRVSFGSFGKLARKWVAESAKARKEFRKYLARLSSAGNGKAVRRGRKQS